MSDNKFDSYFRDKLQDQSSPVPADMWQRIHPEKGRRRMFIFWIWSFVGGAMLVTGLYIGRLGSSHYSNLSHHSRSSHQPDSSHSPNSSRYFNPSRYPGSSPRSGSNLSSYTASLSPITQHLSSTSTRRSITAPKLNPPTDSSKTNKKQQHADSSKWYLDAYVSPDLPLNRGGQLFYTAGCRLGRSFGRHFSGTIGLQYSHIRENIHLDSGEALHLRLKTLDIPLLIGYRTAIGHLTTTITGGVIINIHSWNTLGPNFTTNNLYKSNTGASLYFGLNLIQPLGARLSLFSEPYLRYRLSDMTDVPFLVPNKVNIAGISFGLRYSFK